MSEFTLIDAFSESLIRRDVGIQEFCESDEFCDKLLYPRQRVLLKLIFLEELDGYEEDVLTEWIKASTHQGAEIEISPGIRERVQWLRDNNYSHFPIIQLVGGRRSGKGYMTGAAIAKRLYDLVQLDNPGQHYGVEQGKDIYVSIVADSLEQAKAYQFKDAKNWVLDCRALQDYVGKPLAESISVYTPYDLEREAEMQKKGIKVDSGDLASLRVQAFAKNARTIRGNASIIYVFDEMAHITPGESHISDEQLYEAAEPSLIQFAEDAMLFANSSPYTKTGKFFKIYEEAWAMDANEPVYPTHLMLKFPSWEMYKDHEKFGIKTAIVVDPKYSKQLALKEKANPESFRVEYRSQFAEVIDAYLDPSFVDRMFDPEYTQQVLGRNIIPTIGAVGWWTYKGHGDPSSVGANFGIAVGHTEPVFNERLQRDELHVVFDLIDAFYPEDFENHTIDWLEVVPEIVNVINDFRPFEFTFDQFDSSMPIQTILQELRMLNIQDTQVYEKTATRPSNMRRARNFRTALNLGRVHAPHPSANVRFQRNPIELGRDELKALQEKNGNVIKQDIGPVQTKDIADCMMEVVDALIGESITEEMAMLADGLAPGSRGGYSIGNRGPNSTSLGTPFEEYYQGRGRGGGRPRSWGW